MKLVLTKAFIDVIKPRGEDPKESIIGLDIKFIADVAPAALDELDAGIRPRLFDESGAPTIPELGRCEWRTEYEKGDMNIAGHKVGDTKLRELTFEPKLGGLVEVRGQARCNPDMELTGEISFLLKQTVRLSFTKMTQVPLIKAGEEEGGEEDDERRAQDEKQGKLPEINPLIGKDDKTEDERKAARTKH